ncbi:MAG: protein kinase [Magnetococcus sp. DMHC-6]
METIPWKGANLLSKPAHNEGGPNWPSVEVPSTKKPLSEHGEPDWFDDANESTMHISIQTPPLPTYKDEEDGDATLLHPALHLSAPPLPFATGNDEDDVATQLHPLTSSTKSPPPFQEETNVTQLNPQAPAVKSPPVFDDDMDGATILNSQTQIPPPLTTNPIQRQETATVQYAPDSHTRPTSNSTNSTTYQLTEESELTSAPKKPVDHSDALPTGHMLMWYRIEKVLGQGGFGLTYKAHDTRLDNDVAIKEYLPSQIANRRPDRSIHAKSPDQELVFRKGRQRFLDEARTLAHFKHPSLVRVATFFEENNTAYMAMEYEEGEPLASVLKRERTLEEQDLLRIIMPLLLGVQVLHNENVIHRDIKPDNIFIRTKDGSPVLIDFGSARKTEGAESMTAMLTPNYAPMEQYFEDADRQGPWTDIYSLGAVMYRAISGRKPIGAPQRSNAIMRNQPDPMVPAVEVGEGRYSLPILQAIDLALKVVETDRPRNISEWLKAVKVEVPEDDSQTKKILDRLPKNPKIRIALAAASLLLVAGMGYGIFLFASTFQQSTPILTTAQKLEIEFNHTKTKAENGDPKSLYQMGMAYETGKNVPQNLPTAIKWYQKSAEKNWPEAQFRVAQAYSKGEGVGKDLVLAHSWNKKAAEQGHANAQFILAQTIEKNAKKPEYLAQAMQWYLKAAQQNHPEAQYRVGIALENGDGLEKNPAEALNWFLQASTAKIANAQYHLGVMFEEGRGTQADDKKAAQYFNLAADQGVLEAQFKLATWLNQGKGVEKNFKESALWYLKAANQGHPEAQFQVAQLFNDGAGVRQDAVQALKWFKKSAEQGYLKAQIILARMYQNGQGVEKDPTAAAEWYRKAAQQGDMEAQNGLANHLRDGLGIPRDPSEAIIWYLKAAEQGHAKAQNNLGYMYENGIGVNKDMEQSLKWYQKSAEQYDADALSNLGWLYEEGKGVPKNFATAAKWYLMAAVQGNARAQKNLGWMYEDGRGVKRNLIKAYFWYTLAAVQDDPDALRNLNMISKEMTQQQILVGTKLTKEWLGAETKAKEG